MKANLLIAGDIFPTDVNVKLFENGDTNALFGKNICSLFQNAAYSICNVEGVFTDAVKMVEKASGPKLKTTPQSIMAIRNLGVKCLATANNHIMDFLEQGYRDTIKIIEENGFDYLGSGYTSSNIKKHISLTIGGFKICVYNVAETMYNKPSATLPGVNYYDEYVVCQELAKLKKVHDYLVVIYHGGIEFYKYPSPELKKRFHRMADNGADLITAQHTHCLGCEEKYKGAYLLYGQGNFLFTRHSGHATGGVLIDVDFSCKMPTVSLHSYKHTDNGVILEDTSCLFDFKKRSEKIYDDSFLESNLKEYALTLYPKLSSAFQKYSIFDRFISRFASKRLYAKYRKYVMIYPNKQQLQRILYTLESEQQHETVMMLSKKLLEQCK